MHVLKNKVRAIKRASEVLYEKLNNYKTLKSCLMLWGFQL